MEDIYIGKIPDIWTIGQPARLLCISNDNNLKKKFDKPHFYWFFNSNYIDEQIDERVRVIVNTDPTSKILSELRISHVTPEYNGPYNCQIVNRYAGKQFFNIISKEFLVTDRPTFEGSISYKASDVMLESGQRLQLNCTPNGVEPLTVNWIKDHTALNKNDSRRIQSFKKLPQPRNLTEYTLSVKHVNAEDAGKYSCLAKNEKNPNDVAEWLTEVVVQSPTTSLADQTLLNQFSIDDSSHFTDAQLGMFMGGIIVFLLMLLIYLGKLVNRRMHKKRLWLRRTGIAHFHRGDIGRYNVLLPRTQQANLLPFDQRYEFPLDRLHIDRDQELGRGQFGIVWKAAAVGVQPTGNVTETTTVAVKTIRHADRDEDIRSLIAELKIMLHMGKHVNVVNLLGAVTQSIRKCQLYVIIEYCALGNLNEFLLNNRRHFVNQIDANDEINFSILSLMQSPQMNEDTMDKQTNSRDDLSSPKTSIDDGVQQRRGSTLNFQSLTAQADDGITIQTVTTTNLVSWAFQVASGMRYLAGRGVLHGDLAARNILLCSDRVAKISDFGLSRNLLPEMNYQKMSDDRLPIKWLALESLQHGSFNTATDVWSFGVLVWELFGLGAAVPYDGIACRQMLTHLEAGHRLLWPRLATHRLYDMMRQCWLPEATQRPSFAELVQRLGAMLPAAERDELVAKNEQYMRRNAVEGRAEEGDYLSALLLPPKHQAPAVPNDL